MPSTSSGDYLTKRRLSHEHMDDPQATVADIDEALRFIRIVNHRLGGVAAALSQFQRWAKRWPPSSDSPIRVLDVGTGSADIPLAIAQWAQLNHHHVKITAIDLHPVTIQCARAYIGERNDIELVQADALRLMDRFAAQSFHYAHAGMFIHHLDDIQAMTVLRIMDRLATRGLIWNDLIRGWIGRLGSRLTTLRAPPKVRHDALVSVDAGFTRAEAINLAHRAGWSRLKYRRRLFHRFTLVSEKPT